MANLKISIGANIGVFFGSRSPEHDISIITGQLIISGLKKMGMKVVPVYLDKEGMWRIGDDLGNLKTFTEDKSLAGFEKYYLDLEKSQGRLVFRKKGLAGKEIIVDLAFPAFHGAKGEDGAVQGLFEMFNVPYVGCPVPASAVAMDKILTKQFYKANNIPTTEFVSFRLADWLTDKNAIIKNISKLKWPLFVKPPLLGSSIGITKAHNQKELEFGVEVALHYGNTVLVEEGVEKLVDVTCAVLGHANPKASFLQESVFEKELLSYDDKYLNDGGAQTGKSSKSVVIPARLDDKTTKEIQEMSVKIFKLLGCSGIARFDFLYNKETRQYFANEINPLPGTLYHHLWQKTGVELDQLLQTLLDSAKEAQDEKNRYKTTFESDILKMAKSTKLNLKKDG
ncbi:MAG: hypothetical protein A3C85_01250 [Candidatus Doudnabacteria bacterium RIFCSPHIGHO2_02_FULL_48_21]|uniref:D-alanine--D-alanine ligase n=1 Tax=Candidatus Doudnabacteria bacterium RIFCSPLOWO2_02_FULL_48_13 TaxID=1817845 RepID=A0A1F5QA87_9BACT|nr:MAG: hypothetical protein A3K05_04295 [Candidatus Doudnabacteria bacterium RIFCSPHIGHO2_01_48_18]OGE79583.1 MAG: hypothetical protein A2668_03305 [Candidatus Doudnabacteria bacterium RIFCSPHIGHO2_01_FULL_48_180]OGE91110.1 MAG: hypothetical protein A3F44_02190 [Candidatus Doudnabacteria bacterium RIFCSPHIGHO2_12_FULL_47_25]OGE93800.1 MAG: hypothetical protein A3C85_01250 [Candidatus Doudnabacteria bacterium RIFCSPHIGHO2_02_FULL_48_21]OGE97986.1 MAG: hypothetical protein A3A83_00835 [Candidatu